MTPSVAVIMQKEAAKYRAVKELAPAEETAEARRQEELRTVLREEHVLQRKQNVRHTGTTAGKALIRSHGENDSVNRIQT